MPHGLVLGQAVFLVHINDIDYAVDIIIKSLQVTRNLVRKEEQVLSMQNSLDSGLKWGND